MSKIHKKEKKIFYEIILMFVGIFLFYRKSSKF